MCHAARLCIHAQPQPPHNTSPVKRYQNMLHAATDVLLHVWNLQPAQTTLQGSLTPGKVSACWADDVSQTLDARTGKLLRQHLVLVLQCVQMPHNMHQLAAWHCYRYVPATHTPRPSIQGYTAAAAAAAAALTSSFNSPLLLAAGCRATSQWQVYIYICYQSGGDHDDSP